MLWWGRHLRGCITFGKNISRTQQTVNSTLALVCLAMLHWSSLNFSCHDLVKRYLPTNLLWYSGCFLLLRWIFASSVEPCTSSGSSHCYWFMFGACQLGWTASIDFFFIFWTRLLILWQWRLEYLQRSIAKHDYITLIILTIFLYFLWLMGEKGV